MRAILCLQVWVTLTAIALAADDWQLHGRVIDEAGQPVAGATVGPFWSANGSGKRSDGTFWDVQKEEEIRQFWAHEGEMECRGKSTTTADDGSFALSIHSRYHNIMAMDRDRRRGGVVAIEIGNEDLPAEIKLVPLVRVKGKFEGPVDLPPAWTNVYVMLPENPARPIDNLRIANCGSLNVRFEVALPPGKYILNAYGVSSRVLDEIDLEVSPDVEIELRAGEQVRDLGTLRLQRQTLSNLQQRVIEAKKDGKWGDYTKHYGQSPPAWSVVDARGVKKDVQLVDFRGKWVLVEFWGFSCPACLGTTLPNLIKFYEAHAAERDRFEILAFCIDIDNNLQTVADIDRLLEPIVKNVWHGKALPFPILLDPSFKTAERFGLRGYGTVLLIDPHGNLVEGDELTLAERLKR